MAAETQDKPLSLHWPTLAVAVCIMLVGSLYPPLMTSDTGQVNHALALALLCAMSAGFVRGVGFVPHYAGWRWLFSEWTCFGALAAAICMKYLS